MLSFPRPRLRFTKTISAASHHPCDATSGGVYQGRGGQGEDSYTVKINRTTLRDRSGNTNVKHYVLAGTTIRYT